MRRKISAVIAVAAAAAIGISCADTPTGPGTPPATSPGGCAVDIDALRAMPRAVFGSGSAIAATALAQIDDINAALIANDFQGAKALARTFVSYVHANAGSVTGTIAQLDTMVNTVLCWVGINETSYVVAPSPEPQVRTSFDGNAGLEIPANGVSQPTVITITVVDDHLLTPDDTKLDRYPRSVNVTASGPVAQSVVGVCVTDIPASVMPRLRMGHRTSEGFKVEPPAPVDFLNCGGEASTGARAKVRKVFGAIADFLLPRKLYARQEAFLSGGVGGTAGEYSPFEPVDIGLSFSGGVGGTAGEYIRMGGTGNAMAATSSETCANAAYTAGSAIALECRPQVQVTTANGTVLQNVPVAWAVTAGNGAAASENPTSRECAVFGSAAANATNTNGKAGACWTTGALAGTNTLVATVSHGGDAPEGVTFLPATQTFSVSTDAVVPAASAVGANVPYDGAPHPGSGTCSHGLTPRLGYSGDGSVPINVGTYTLTVSCGEGDATSAVATATAAIIINPAAPAIAITCPTSVVYTGDPHTPCTATVSAPGLNATPTPTYVANMNAGIARATVSVAAGSNYAAASVTREFHILPAPTTVALTCPNSVAYTGAAQTPCVVAVTGPELETTGPATYTMNRNAGTALVEYRFAGGGNYVASTGSASFAITPITATAVAGSGTMAFGGAVPSLPCVVNVLPVDAGAVTCTTSVPGTLNVGANVTTPVVLPATPANYTIVPVNGTLSIGYAQNDCFAWPLPAAPPARIYGVVPGLPIPAVCRLENGAGALITTARGDLEVFDVGPDAVSIPVRVGSVTNAFSLALGAYWAWVNTEGLARGRYYRVVATWDDGSTSAGYFYVRD